MKRTVKQDPFFLDQPPLAFLEELRSPMHRRPLSYGSREMAEGEVDARGLYIAECFSEGDSLLRTIYEDFERFTAEYPSSLRRFAHVPEKHGRKAKKPF